MNYNEINILYFIPSLRGCGGLQKVLIQRAHYFNSKFPKVKLLFFTFNNDGLDYFFEIDGIEIIESNRKNHFLGFSLFKELNRCIRVYRIDVLINVDLGLK